MSPLFNSVDLAAVRKNRSLTLMENLPYRTLAVLHRSMGVSNAMICCTRIGVPTPFIYLINKTNKSLNSLVAQV